MRERRIVRTPAVGADLAEIWSYVAADSPKAADRLLDSIAERIHQLSRYPELGPKRPDVAPDVRVLGVERYLVMYRLRDDLAEIVRVVHGARDVTALF